MTAAAGWPALQAELRERRENSLLSFEALTDLLNVATDGEWVDRRKVVRILTERATAPGKPDLEPVCRVLGLAWPDATSILETNGAGG